MKSKKEKEEEPEKAPKEEISDEEKIRRWRETRRPLSKPGGKRSEDS